MPSQQDPRHPSAPRPPKPSLAARAGRISHAVDDARLAAEAVLGSSPLVGLSQPQIIDALRRLVLLMARSPLTVARIEASLALEQGRILLGLSRLAPRADDVRFADPVWQRSRYYRRVMQAYLAWSNSLDALLHALPGSDRDKARAGFLVHQIVAMAAPTNFPGGHPEFPRRLWATRGGSLLTGLTNLLTDLRDNGGLPRQVDAKAFEVGRNLAATPGAVVFRNAVCEVIQYAPVTEIVNALPVLILPPQINKYYIIDLAPGRSFIEHAVKQGQQVFCVSWRNPTAAQRDWGLETYVSAAQAALEAVLEITGSESTHLVAACAGGMTAAVLAACLQAQGRGRQVRSLSLLVTILDTRARTLVGLFADERTVRQALEQSRQRGVLDGREMARAFAWLRPDDLIWRFHTNNYVLGRSPPAFDILFWNNDNTRLPAQFHADLLQIFRGNPLRRSGGMKILGQTIDLNSVTCPVFVVAGESDHITPWEACYRSAALLGGRKRFLLCAAGHIQSIVNPPRAGRGTYREHRDTSLPAEQWLQRAQIHKGSWWNEWLDWVNAQSRKRSAAPVSLGSERHTVLEAAPGRYVHQL